MSNIDQISVLRKLMWNVGDKHTFFCHVWMWKVGPKIRNMDNSWGCQEVAKMILVHVVSLWIVVLKDLKLCFLRSLSFFWGCHCYHDRSQIVITIMLVASSSASWWFIIMIIELSISMTWGHTVDGCEILHHFGWLTGAGFRNHPPYVRIYIGPPGS